MRILVTGGTGFLGSHSIQALLAAGHEVRLLVRDPSQVTPSLAPLGVEVPRDRIIVGDVLDPGSVRHAIEGVDALLHAANVYSLNAGQAGRVHAVNVDGTRIVLGQAARAGLDPIVHVSTTVALLPSSHLTERSPVGDPYGPYPRSKADAERIARVLQQEGASIVIAHPGSVFGPHQPHLGESAQQVRNILVGRARISIRGGFSTVDVRDVADGLARTFVAGRGPRNYLFGGTWTAYADLFHHLTEIVGHRLPRLYLPWRPVWWASRLADVAQRRGIDPGFSSTAVWICDNHGPVEDHHTRDELGLRWRPFEETLRDTVRWLYERGEISARQAGQVASQPPVGGTGGAPRVGAA